MMPAMKFVPPGQSAMPFRFFFPPPQLLILAGLFLLPVAALAQVSYTGTAATQNFGSQAIGSASAARTFNFSVAAGTTVGSIGVVTQGAPNLDFTSATGGTCALQTYSSATTCTVNVTLTPKVAGLRMGAVVFFSGSGSTGTILGKVPVYGIGTGPQIAFSPSPAIAIDPMIAGFQGPLGAAVDGAGDLFITVQVITVKIKNNVMELPALVEMPAGGGAARVIDTSFGEQPWGVAVDGAGDLFVADLGQGSVVEIPAGGGATTNIDPTVNGLSLARPAGVAVDGAGDLYIADYLNNRVVEVPSGGGAAIAIAPAAFGTGFFGPESLALDGAGDLFIGPDAGASVVEVPAGGGAATAIQPTVNGEGLLSPRGLAVDAAGDLFIADTGNSRVVAVLASGGSAIAIDPTANGKGLYSPTGLALDGAGDLFIVDDNNNRVVELQRSQPPALNFPTATLVGSTDTADGTKTVQISNIGNEALTLAALSYPADFPEASGDASACTNSTSLSAGQECDLPVEFTPQNTGMLSEGVTLTDNSLNVTGAQQSIGVSGTSGVLEALTSPAPGSMLAGSSATFIWTAGVGATEYDLWLGFNGAGSSDLYSSGVTTATSATLTGLQTKGTTIYARLYYEIAGVWHHLDYTYTEATSTPATMISPAQGNTLGVSSVMFNWTAGTLITNYALWLGTNGPGSSSLYASPLSAATSVTVPKLPANGVKVYARLFSEGSGGIQYVDYTYTAQ
jgi:sugar lactone lactonase YvrE